VSRYVARGAALSTGPVLQPAIMVGIADFVLTPWLNINLTDADGGLGWSEFDLSLEYSREVAGFNLQGLVGGYFYPGESPELEFGLGGSRVFGDWELGLNNYFPVLPLPVGYYGELNGVLGKEFSEQVSADFRVALGLGSGGFNEKNVGVNRWGLSVVESELGLNWLVGGVVNIRPLARLVLLPDRYLRAGSEPKGWFFVAGLTIGNDF